MIRNWPAYVLLLAAGACTDRDSSDKSAASTEHGGTLVVSVGGDPDLLLPPLTSTVTGKIINDLVYDRLAEIGDSLGTVGDVGFEPRLARAWQWASDSLSVAFQLNPDARWHDGVPVRASDVRFTHRLYSDPRTGSPFAALIGNIDSVSVRDSTTAVFWFRARSPLQFFDAVNVMSILPEHSLDSAGGQALRTAPVARAPIGSGRFRFVRWRAGSSLELAADTTNYRGRPGLERVIFTIAPDFNTALTRVVAGEADMLEQVPVVNAAQLAARPDLKMSTSPGLDYNFVQFNLRDPKNKARPHALFADRALRRALTMAVDRNRTVQNVYDTLASVALGPTVRAYPTTDPSLRQIAHAPAEATRILDSLGWKDANKDGTRERNGRPLRFTLLVPSSSKARVSMAVLIQDQLKKVGVTMDIERLEFAAFVNRETLRDFDAVFGSWHVEASPGGVRQTWGTEGSRTAGGSNYGSYQNASFDAHVDSALASATNEDRRRHFTQAYGIIIEDAPAIWMAEPQRVMAIHRRIEPRRVRADAWWAHLDDWTIPAASRIARDRTQRTP
ncbi:MAG TPA: peptide ABC transporter substrate-binding protein [Gemmatimonadaceae bacterium]|nr:peptide ABC transporter substrate-binding protein [Gemmatimonadaceae bacterium]